MNADRRVAREALVEVHAERHPAAHGRPHRGHALDAGVGGAPTLIFAVRKPRSSHATASRAAWAGATCRSMR